MLATSRATGALRRRSSIGCRRSPSKSGDEHVVLDDQHPSQMEIAVQAHIEAFHLRRHQPVQAIMQVSCCARKSSIIARSASPNESRRCLTAWKTRAALWTTAVVQRATSAGWIGSGRKVGHSACAGQSQVQLGTAPADLRQVTQIGGLLFAFPPAAAGCKQALLLEQAIEIGRRDRPGVTLVADLGVNDCDRVLSFAFDQFRTAEHRRRIGEAGDLGQEPADLDLGVHAAFEFPEQLHDVVGIDLQRAAEGAPSTG